MSVKVAKNRLIFSSLQAGFYQHLINRMSGFQELGERLVRQAEIAYWFRQSNIVEEVGLMLSNIPLKEYQLIGQYYLGWCAYRRGEATQSVFENVIENSRTYKAKGLMSLAASEVSRQDYGSAFKLCEEVIKWTDNPSLLLTSSRSIAFLKSLDGDHKQALNDLEKLAPLARYANPVAYYNYLNSLAVEYLEAGRIEEARNISNIVLASPYAFAYPEWRDTREDIERKGYRSSRSFVPIIQGASQHNIVRLPERESIPISQDQPGRVLHFDWKAMVKKRNNETDEAIDAMDEKELLVKLIQLTALEDVDRNKLRTIVKFAIKVMTEQNKK